MQIKDVITGQPHLCAPEAKLREVAAMMVDHDCGAIPVVGRGAKAVPLGIVTDRDIVARFVARGIDPQDRTAEEAMTDHPVTVDRNEDIERAMDLMREHKVRRLIVVDESENVAGVLSLADVARTRPDKETARTVESISQPTRSASNTPGS